MTDHLPFMERCLALAEKGLGHVAPNPLVGCVIVHKGAIIGEGYHERYGEAHAEVNAIRSVENKDLLREATLYVNLEPCAHHGKTPPCADLIIAHKLKQVVIANRDPNPLVAGKGIDLMKKNEIDVVLGVMEKKGRFLNRRFFTWIEKKRPYIILKWAQTQDGFIAPLNNKQLWLTGQAAKQLSHQWRAQEASILIGTNTALIDNPQLTTRLWEGKNPIRLVIDRQNKLPDTLAIKNEEAPTIVFTEKHSAAKMNSEYITLDFNKPILPELLDILTKKNISTVIVEGGAHTLNQFIEQNYWDEARVFTAPMHLTSGLRAPYLLTPLFQQEHIGEDVLSYYSNFET